MHMYNLLRDRSFIAQLYYNYISIYQANMKQRSVWLQTSKQSISEENMEQVLTSSKWCNCMDGFEFMPLKDLACFLTIVRENKVEAHKYQIR